VQDAIVPVSFLLIFHVGYSSRNPLILKGEARSLQVPNYFLESNGLGKSAFYFRHVCTCICQYGLNRLRSGQHGFVKCTKESDTTVFRYIPNLIKIVRQ
jgi:hypothetical protein